jgi:cytochrome b
LKSTSDAQADGSSGRGGLVWDLPLRLTHWALVLTVAGAWATHYAGTQWFAWHERLGYATLVLVAFRVAWGFVGTRHAQFANFLRGPAAVLEYLRGGAEPVGHNPLGALSVLAMLAVLLFQASTGLFANDEIANAGPFYGWISQETSNRLTGLHATNSELLLILLGLHVAAVAWYAIVRRRRLVPAMLTGRKDGVPPGETIASSRVGLAVVIVAMLAVALALAIRAAPEGTIALF